MSLNNLPTQSSTRSTLMRWQNIGSLSLTIFRRKNGEGVIDFVAGLYVQSTLHAKRVANIVRKAQARLKRSLVLLQARYKNFKT